MVCKQAVYLDQTLPREMRLQAIIQFKNGIDKFWRASSKNAIKSEQKKIIRDRIFQGSIEEGDRSLSLQNSLAVAKIVRIDFPQDWPDVLSQLVDMLRRTSEGNQHHLGGILGVLLRIIKELGTARLRKSQTALQSVSGEMLFVAGEIYTKQSSVWFEFFNSGKGDEDKTDIALQNSLISLKLLRRLALLGFDSPHHDAGVQHFWSLTQEHFDQFLGLVSHDSLVPAPFQDDVGKHLLQFTKLHLEMAESHPVSFAMLPNAIPLCMAYWVLVSRFSDGFHKSNGLRSNAETTDGESRSKVDGPLLERLALKGLLLFKSCVRMVFWPQQTFRYLNPQQRAEKGEAIEIIKKEFFKDDFVIEMTKVIITNLFVFRRSDLEAWEEDPQEWELQEHSQGSAWEWEVRPAAERLFLDLLSNYKDLLLPPLLTYAQSAVQPDSDLVTKEKVYATIGLAAAHLDKAFNFNGLLQSTMAEDAQKSGREFKVLRRRIAIVIGQWCSIQLADENRPLIYEIFRHFLNPEDGTNDAVVQLTAARELSNVMSTMPSTPEGPLQFAPFAVDIVTRLLTLIDNAEHDETKLAILSTMREIVSKMDEKVKAFSDLVMAALPSVWETSGTEEYMIKQAVMAIISSMVMSLKGTSPNFCALVMPVLEQAVQPTSDLHFHLIDESLELWETIQMQSTRPITNQLITLAEMAIKLLENQTENIQKCLEIVKNYILLSPETMLSENLRSATLHALFLSLGARGRDTIQTARQSIWMMIKFSHDLGGEGGLAAIVKDMMAKGYIADIMTKIHLAWEASQTTGPNRKPNALSILTEIDYFLILGRIALCDPKIFAMMLSELGQLDQLWNWLSSRWFANFDSMSNGEYVKESCLALTRLLELPSPMQEMVLSKLQDYFSMWTTVVVDVRTEASNGQDAYVWENPNEVFEWDTPLDILTRRIMGSWEAHSSDTWTFIMARLQDLINQVGGEQAFQEKWVVNVDKEVVESFQQLSSSR